MVPIGSTFSRLRREGRSVTLTIQERWNADTGAYEVTVRGLLGGVASNADGTKTAALPPEEMDLTPHITGTRITALKNLAGNLFQEWMAERSVTDA